MQKNITKKRVVFMGTPDYATSILKGLVESDNYDITLVVTQPDKPVGRKKVLTPPDAKVYALTQGIEIFQPKTLKEQASIDIIKSQNADFIIVAAFGQILPEDILSIAPCINLHASLLPIYRGASPIQSSLLNNDKITGVTAMLMDKGLDTGDILGFKTFEIPNNMMGLDIGPASELLFEQALSDAKTILWNGPMGVYEMEKFSKGSYKLAHAVARSFATTVVGGGDTADLVRRTGDEEAMTFISTGGGASLELIEGKILPGVKALIVE